MSSLILSTFAERLTELGQRTIFLELPPYLDRSFPNSNWSKARGISYSTKRRSSESYALRISNLAQNISFAFVSMKVTDQLVSQKNVFTDVPAFNESRLMGTHQLIKHFPKPIRKNLWDFFFYKHVAQWDRSELLKDLRVIHLRDQLNKSGVDLF